MKRKHVHSRELVFLREQIAERYRLDGGTELEWKSYLPRYDDLCARIEQRIHGRHDAAISTNILRRLFWDTLETSGAVFNIVYLNAFAAYISEGALGYLELTEGIRKDPVEEPVAQVDLPASEDVALQQDEVAHLEQPVQFEIEQPHILGNEHSSQTNNEEDHDQLLHTAGQQTFPVFARPFLIAALFSGLLSFAFTLMFNEISGYERLGHVELKSLTTSLFGFTIFGHLAIGISLALFARWLCRLPPPRCFHRTFLLFSPILFVVSFYIRQLFVRDGWLVRGSACEAFFGYPDFETVAIALVFSLCIFLFLLVLRNGLSDQQGKLLRTTFITLCCGTVFFGIGAAHNILVSGGWLNEQGYLVSRSFLNFRFPHPERLPLICFMVFVQVYLTLKFVGEHFQEITSLVPVGQTQSDQW